MRVALAVLSFLPVVWGDYWVVGLALDCIDAETDFGESRNFEPLADIAAQVYLVDSSAASSWLPV